MEYSRSLSFLNQEAHAELSPDDARRLGVEHGQDVELSAGGQSVRARVTLRTGTPTGVVFLLAARLPDGPGGDRAGLRSRARRGARMIESTVVLIVKAIVIFAFVLGMVPMILLLERKLLGRFQSRIGPNRVGPCGAAPADGRRAQAALQGAVHARPPPCPG